MSQVPEATRDVPGEHRAIVEAVLDRHADLATARLQAHYELTTQLSLESDAIQDAADEDRAESRARG